MNSVPESRISPIAADLGKVALLFAFAAGVALLGIVQPGGAEPGVVSFTVVLLGISWVGLFAATKWSEAAPHDARRLRLLSYTAAITMGASILAAIGAAYFAVERGLTIQLPAVSTDAAPVRGAWLVWLFPAIGCVATIGSLIIARTIYRVTRQIGSLPRGPQ